MSHDAVELYHSSILMDALQFLEDKMANDTKWARKLTLHYELPYENCNHHKNWEKVEGGLTVLYTIPVTS